MKTKISQAKPKNIAAKNLSDRRYYSRIVLSKKAYTRKGRNPNSEEQ
jgi:hypothetical protein